MTLRSSTCAAQPPVKKNVSRVVTVRAAVADADASATRRGVLSGLVSGIALAAVGTAQARDYREALAKKEARRAKLKGKAGDMKSSGKDEQIFKTSDYMVSEEARTPNVHSRQNEGAKTQENV